MKNVLILLLLNCGLCLSITAQFVSEEKNSDNYFGIFGETSGSLLSQESFYVNIGKDFIQSTKSSSQPISTISKLKLNPFGNPVEMGGEVQRSSTGVADLLPYAYGEISNDTAPDQGTNNYTSTPGMDGSGLNYVDITFSDASINTLDLIIVASPRSGVPITPNIVGDEGEIKNGYKSSLGAIGLDDATQVFIDHLDTNGSNTCRVYLFTRTGATTGKQYFSFVAYKL